MTTKRLRSRALSRRRGYQRQFISFFSARWGWILDLRLLAFIALLSTMPIPSRVVRFVAIVPTYASTTATFAIFLRACFLAIWELNRANSLLSSEVAPCQAFSTAGRRLGLNDERGNVFLHFISLIGELRPKYAIFENVRGLLSAPLLHRPHEQRGPNFAALSNEEHPGGALLHILQLLEDAGYQVTFTLYNTANFGVPQIRERLIFFASRDGRKVPFMKPTHDELGRLGLPRWVTVRDAIGHFKENEQHAVTFPVGRLRYYRLLHEGQNWRNLPSKLQREAMGESWHAGGGKTGFYRRLAWDRPSPTLVTRPTMKATDLCHPEKLRPLSVEEYAAIQTFPNGYIFEGKLDDQYRQIGNAVPCSFGEAIGRHIVAFDEGMLAECQSHGKLSRYDGTDHSSWRESVAWMERQLSLACK